MTTQQKVLLHSSRSARATRVERYHSAGEWWSRREPFLICVVVFPRSPVPGMFKEQTILPQCARSWITKAYQIAFFFHFHHHKMCWTRINCSCVSCL